MRHKVFGIALSVISIVSLLPQSGTASPRAIGDTRVFARVPAPGQPAGIVVRDGTVWVSSLGLFNQPIGEYPVWRYAMDDGELLGTTKVSRFTPSFTPAFCSLPSGTNTASFMALYGLAFDASERLYVVDMNGALVRIDPRTGRQETYAWFPPEVMSITTMPVTPVFDAAGNAYVTEHQLGGIWKVPPGGGIAELWFQDPRVFGWPQGPAGMVMNAERTYLIFTVPRSAFPTTEHQGLVFRLPIADPSPENLELLYSYPIESEPVGVTLGASGNLYVALMGLNQVSILRPDRTEALRFPSAEENARREIPFDKPIGVALASNGSLLVSNASWITNDHWAIFDVFVDDAPVRPATPVIP